MASGRKRTADTAAIDDDVVVDDTDNIHTSVRQSSESPSGVSESSRQFPSHQAHSSFPTFTQSIGQQTPHHTSYNIHMNFGGAQSSAAPINLSLQGHSGAIPKHDLASCQGQSEESKQYYMSNMYVEQMNILHNSMLDKSQKVAAQSTSKETEIGGLTEQVPEENFEDKEGNSGLDEVPQYVQRFSQENDTYNKTLCNRKDYFGDHEDYKNIPLVSPESVVSPSPPYYWQKPNKSSQYEKNSTLEFLAREPDERFMNARSSVEKLNYHLLVAHIMESQKRRFAIVGEAGAGKTTLIKRLLKDFSNLEHRCHAVVVFRYFSGFLSLKKTTPCKMLFGGIVSDSSLEKRCYQWLLKHQERVIFFFDGLDQAPWSIEGEKKIPPFGKGSEKAIMSNIFERTLFPDSKVVYTSREFSVVNLDGKFRPDTVITLMGLSENDTKLLFTSLVGEKGEQAWLKLVTQSSSIIPVLSTPVFVCFTAYTYEGHSDNPPNNVTRIMQNLIERFKRSPHIDGTSINEILTFLRKLAYRGMVERRVMYESDDFKDTELAESQISSLVITAPRTNLQNQRLLDGDKRYFYCHQSVQEFLAGECLSYMDLRLFENAVHTHMKDGYWFEVTRFVVGILLNENAASAPIQDMQRKRVILKKMLAERKHDPNSRPWNKLLFFSILAESNDAEFIQELLGDKINTSEILLPISASGMRAVASVVSRCIMLQEVNLISLKFNPAKAKILWDNIRESDVKISKLAIRGDDLNAEVGQIVGKLAEKCHVNELAMENSKLSGVALNALLSSVGNAKITLLNLSYCEINVEGNEIFPADIKHCEIVKLTLIQCYLTDKFLTAFKSITQGMKISYLDVSYNCFGVNGIRHLAKTVRQCMTSALMMVRCNFTDEFLESFLMESKDAKIPYLDISDNYFHVDGFRSLGKLVKQCMISSLKVQSCNLTDESLEVFLSESSGAKLSKLDVRNNPLSQHAIDQIRPSISVEELELRNVVQ